jgi:hypothetical protein
MRFAPRLHPRLFEAIVKLDDPGVRIADTHRRVGELADRHGLPRPSYERVRQLVHHARRRRVYPTTTEVLLDIAFRTRPPLALGDHLAGTLPPSRHA